MKNAVLDNGTLHVEISPVGAELQSIRDAGGVERLYQGDTPFWTSRAPVLFPVAGGYKDDRYRMNGQTYEMNKHGFTRRETFEIEESCATSATFLLTKRFPGFPFAYAFRARYTLVGNALRVAYITDSTGDDTFWFCVGGHEGYRVPEGIEDYEIVFERDEALIANVLNGNLLTHETRLIDSANGVMPLKYEYFSVDAQFFTALRSRHVELRSKSHDRRVRVEYTGFSCLGLWTKPGAPYICIEPWMNAPDYEDTDGQIERKPGSIRLAPGERDIREHVITIL